ncbi:bifunctional Delta(1)-pyrroline-2-carboxylate/Delta(1)-piperideine-2-carboxylate reductase [Achromobacter spanius]|uniref:bifunctional Delta(1)-pyrroline-2-carboxylate/Delta(1)-piperideine-2- carboxylate reductase n=1 Tax=Achromobacter spanius TaxID=217203 RepID=UPI003814F0F0
MTSSKAIPATPESASITMFDRVRTAELLPFADVIDALVAAADEYEKGDILSPERMVVPLGKGGVLLSMPATATDIGIHKLVNVQPSNTALGIPTIHGTVTVCDAETGKPLFALDGPEVTGRRTAAVTLLAIRELNGAPKNILLYGTGAQARYHVQALSEIYPDARIWVRGLDEQAAVSFSDSLCSVHPRIAACPQEIPDEVDVVITVTTSTMPIYDAVGKPGRLIIGVGAFKPEMAEIGKTTLDSSVIFSDDPAGARHEAGDLLRAKIDWARVRSLGSLLREGAQSEGPFVFKSVGTGAWDLAAARVAVRLFNK